MDTAKRSGAEDESIKKTLERYALHPAMKGGITEFKKSPATRRVANQVDADPARAFPGPGDSITVAATDENGFEVPIRMV